MDAPPPTRADACRQISCALVAALALAALTAWLSGSVSGYWAGGTASELAQLSGVERHADSGEYGEEVTLHATYAYEAGGARHTFERVLPEGPVPELAVVRYWRRDPGATYSGASAGWGVVWRWALALVCGGLALIFACSIPLSAGEWLAAGRRVERGSAQAGKPGGLLLSLFLAGLCGWGAFAGYGLARGAPRVSEVEATFLYGTPTPEGYEAVVLYRLPGLDESLKTSLLLPRAPAEGSKHRLSVLAGQPGWFPRDLWGLTRALLGWGAVALLTPLGLLLALVFAAGVSGRASARGA